MTTSEILQIIAAVVGALVVIGGGLKWVFSAAFGALKENTKAIVDSGTTMTKAVTDASAANVSATNSLRLELREHRVEIRTLIGMKPPPDDDDDLSSSDDGEPAPLTPIRGVPATPTHLIVNRKGTKS